MNPDVIKLVLAGLGITGTLVLCLTHQLAPEAFITLLVGLGITSPIDSIKSLLKPKVP